MRTRALAATALAGALLLGGCGTGDRSEPASSRDSTPSAGSSAGPSSGAEDMSMDMGSADEPSQPASMICSEEIQDAVRRTFGMRGLPATRSSWAKADRVFSCRHAVPGGTLRLSVQDALAEKQGSAYFAALRRRTTGAEAIGGMENFGFPAFDTASGKVAFLKDGKTLLVDASRLPTSALPKDYDRREAAYSIAAAVIACWSE